MKIDIITIGSATCDIFAQLGAEFVMGANGEGQTLPKTGRVCPSLPAPVPAGFWFGAGSKNELVGLKITSGGGATNTAVGLANFGLKTAPLIILGKDILSEIILEDLKKAKVNLSFIQRSEKEKTNVSIILTGNQGGNDRAILSCWGKEPLCEKGIDWKKLKKAKWFYIAPLHKEATNLLLPLLEFAKKNKIKTAVNPSQEQIEKAKQVFKGLDVLLVNEKEASLFFSQEKNEQVLIQKIAQFSQGIAVLTKGKDGCLVSDGKQVFVANANPQIQAKERTGAGDAFGSGFITGLFLQNDIQYSIRLGLANAEGCIQQIGAKAGLLGERDLEGLPEYAIKRLEFRS